MQIHALQLHAAFQKEGHASGGFADRGRRSRLGVKTELESGNVRGRIGSRQRVFSPHSASS